jgi:hypothetical protein
MMNLRLHYRDAALDEWTRTHPAEARRAARMFLVQAGHLVRRTMAQVCLQKFQRTPGALLAGSRNSGSLVASIRPELMRDHVWIGPNVPHAAAVNDGSRPHVIRPRRARALHWMTLAAVGAGSRGKRGHFAAEVHHPGFAGHHFVEEAAVRAHPQLELLAARVWGNALTRRTG